MNNRSLLTPTTILVIDTNVALHQVAQAMLPQRERECVCVWLCCIHTNSASHTYTLAFGHAASPMSSLTSLPLLCFLQMDVLEHKSICNVVVCTTVFEEVNTSQPQAPSLPQFSL